MGIEQLLGKKIQRGTVIILHPTALPEAIEPKKMLEKDLSVEYRIGELGTAAFEFIDFLEATGTLAWQINPFGHTGEGNSPYQTFSRFAGSPYMISIEKLVLAGHLSEEQNEEYIKKVKTENISEKHVDFGWLFRNKIGENWSEAILRQAHENFCALPEEEKQGFGQFCTKEAHWLNDYAEFMAIKELHDNKAWNKWEEKFRDIDSWRTNRAEFLKENAVLAKTIDYFKYLQYIFFSQWDEVVAYAAKKDRKIIGDLPWYVGYDSADVWARREIFKLDEQGEPTHVAGVPPDYFSETGQLWGNPIYDWQEEATYKWWLDSLEFILDKVDLVRFDHARAIDTYWEIPQKWAVEKKTAINGMWCKGPGRKLLEEIRRRLDQNDRIPQDGQLPFIFEDLGYLDKVYPSIEEYPEDLPEDKIFKIAPGFAEMLRKEHPDVQDGLMKDGGYDPRQGLDQIMKDYEIPWMAVAQFGFEDKRMHPNNLPYNCVAYTGTHDNDTTAGWCAKQNQPESFSLGLMEMVLGSKAVLAGFPWQDLWCLGSEMRTNQPGDTSKEGGWWTSRLLRKQLESAPKNVIIGLRELNLRTKRYVE